MIDINLEPVYQKIMGAEKAEDLFGHTDSGLPPQILREKVWEVYNRLRLDVNPEDFLSVTDAEYAQEALDRLEELKVTAEDVITRGLYGVDFVGYNHVRQFPSFAIGDHAYHRGALIHEGTDTSLYDGYFLTGDVYGEAVIKIANSTNKNYLIDNEIRILDALHEGQVPQWKHLPFLIEKFKAGNRKGVVLRKIKGLSVRDLRACSLHKNGLDQKHVAWIMDRLFSLLGYVHRQGVIHGDINPDHIFIRPSNHNAILCNWSRSVRDPASSFEVITKESTCFDAPEITNGKGIGPWTDIYAFGKTLIWLVGGDPVENIVPDFVEPRVRSFLLNMVRESAKARPRDAWALYKSQCELKDSLWPRRFIRLDVR